MIKNYLKVAFRNLIKHKNFTFINVSGLALSITASALIWLWVSHETSYDKYHENSENIYRVTSDFSLNGQKLDVCLATSALAGRLKELEPSVVNTARITKYFDQIFKYNGVSYKEERVIRADTGFFQIFSFTFLEGNPEKPFYDRESVVLTRSAANRFFGNESALGKKIIINDNNSLTVSAVIEDMPANSHNHFEIARYFDIEDSWDNFNWMTYVLINDESSVDKVRSTLDDIVNNDILPQITNLFGMTIEQFKNSDNYIRHDIQPLESIHLNSNYYSELEANGNKTYVTFFSVIAIFILVVAGINYMNLSMAYYDARIMEVGIRKANGATSLILVKQFLFETLLISTISFVIGAIAIYVLLPLYTNFFEININVGISKSGFFLLLLFGLTTILGILSGVYPAAYLSKFKTATNILNNVKSAKNQLFSARSALVIVQFAITIVVITSSFLIKKQVKYLTNKDLGYSQEQLLILEGVNSLGDKKDAFKQELLNNPNISGLSFSDTYPGKIYNNITNYNLQERSTSDSYVLKTIGVSYDYFNTYGMEISLGRNFKENDYDVVILNETAVKYLSIEDNPLNYHIRNFDNQQASTVIGIVKDFHHEALNTSLDPMIIRLSDIRSLNYMTIKLTSNNYKASIDDITKTWSEFTNNLPIEYCFLDEKLQSAYNAEMKAGKVFSIFSILSILIACMGILGLATFIMRRRIKEIGIRKVNGAKIRGILGLLNVDFVKWVFISFIISCPVGYFSMKKWLENFAYQTELSWWIFALAGIITLAIALLTVSLQSWRAASRNPVEALRYE